MPAANSRPTIRELLDEERRLPPFAWPGGYAMVYYAKDDCAPMCATCASMALDQELDWAPTDWDSEQWIEELTLCCHCNKVIIEERN